MNEQNQGGNVRTSNRRGRGCSRWLGAGLAALVALALVGYIYEPIAEAADAKAYPPPGQMVDVGGYRLHINCTGEGSPLWWLNLAGGIFLQRGVGCSPKSPRAHAFAPTIGPGWGGARSVPSHGLPGNLLKSC